MTYSLEGIILSIVNSKISSETAFGSESVFVARQPIFDSNETPWGYELLYRASADAKTAEIDDDDMATRSIIADGISLALEGLPAERRRVLINFPETMLLEDVAYALPSENCVVEVLETVSPTSEVLDALTRLREAGYTIAMDDYGGEESLEPFLEHVDIIKVDILALENDKEKLQAVVDKLAAYKALILAEKVEDKAVFETARDMGFDLFQGFFFSKPELVPGKKLTANEVSKLQLLQELGKEDFEPKRIAEILQSDPSLSYRLFRHINSAGFSLASKVDSLDRAITILGQQAITQWLRTAIMSDLNPAPMAGELVFLSVHRAKFLELLANETGMSDNVHPDSFFVVGLFSLLDAMMGIHMKEILSALPLDELISCTLEGTCKEHTLLRLAHSYERGYWADTDHRLKSLELDHHTADNLYVQARQWAQKALAT